MRCSVIGLLCLVAPVGLLGPSCGPECEKKEDCILSQAATKYGGCAPLEYWCASGSCKAICGASCKIVMADFDPCPAGLVCAQPRVNQNTTADSSYFCTALPIPCQSADDCPVFTPSLENGPAAGSPGVWSCENGFCRFPGLSYLSAE